MEGDLLLVVSRPVPHEWLCVKVTIKQRVSLTVFVVGFVDMGLLHSQMELTVDPAMKGDLKITNVWRDVRHMMQFASLDSQQLMLKLLYNNSIQSNLL